jgi:cell wall-associated NlpC family hydrolase
MIKIIAGTVLMTAVAIAVLPVVIAVGVTGAVAAAPVAPADDGGAVAVAWALGQLGKPYAWGAAGPDAFDCSGLVLRAWAVAGVALPRVAADQYDAGGHVPVGDAEPGDLVFFATDPGDPSTIVHVGISLGDGRMVDAPHTGAVVRVERVWADGLVALATRP